MAGEELQIKMRIKALKKYILIIFKIIFLLINVYS